MKAKVKTIAIMMAAAGIVSCSSTDLYDENAIAEREAAEFAAKHEKIVEDYKANFVKTYGEISSTQSWDFSNNDEYYYLPSSSLLARTRANNDSWTKTISQNYYQIQQATLTKMHDVFRSGEDNRALGRPFALTVPDNDFTIMPLYLGQSGGDFDLCMYVEGIGEILVFKKWEYMQAKFAGNNNWQNLYKEGYKWTLQNFFPTKVWVRESTTDGKNTLQATAIQSKGITFHGLPAGAKMYFYLKITQAAEGWNTKGQSLGMANNYMREYQFAEEGLPTGLPGVTNPQVKIIGCEDASRNSDYDFDDAVIMMYGEPYVPQSFIVTDITREVVKRYMIEDLGKSKDTDFNDIVVDVVSSYKVQQTTGENGIPSYGEPVLQSRRAEIKALGGTLDFELNIGGTKWKKSSKYDVTEMINTKKPNYNEVLHTITLPTLYNPDSNDIKVTVYQKDNDKLSYDVNFPPTGSVPCIIAIDPIADWAVENEPFNYGLYVNSGN